MKPALLSCQNHVISKLKKYKDHQLHMFVLETAPFVMHYTQYGMLDKRQLKMYTEIVRAVYATNQWVYTREFEDALQNMLFDQASTLPVNKSACNTASSMQKKIERIILQLSNYMYSYQGIVSSTYPVHISATVIEQIKTQLHKYGIADDTITSLHIVSLLKSMKLVKYYEHSAIIYRMLTGKSDTFAVDTAQLISDDVNRLCAYIREADSDVWKLCIDTGAHYLFFQIMHKNKHPYMRDMFFPAKTLLKKRCQDMSCRKVFENLNWQFWPL